MATDILLECRCGALQGVVGNVPASLGDRMVCRCDDCQAYAHYLGCAEDVLDADGGTDVFPARPANLEITRGAENLRCVRLTGKGMYRWYAGCCSTPIANSMPSHRMPFAGVFSANVKQGDAGPVRAVLGAGKVPLKVIFRTLRYLLSGWIRKQHAPSPFFDSATGAPKAAPYVLTPSEREDLRALCRPKSA